MRVRLAVSFVVLLGLFGWVLSRAITHSTVLRLHYNEAAQQHHIGVAFSLFMAILFPVVAVGAWLLVARTLRPLRALSRQAGEASAEHLHTRLVSPSSDSEMVELVATLNGLLERIELTAAAKSQFYAAASHELRTPLQALSGHLETTLSQDRTADEYRDALVEAQKQSTRLTTLTRDILLLHQLQDQGVLAGEQADVAESVRVAVRELSPLMEARGLNLVVNSPQTLTVSGRQSYADIAVRNLMENAARYATTGGSISVELMSSQFVVRNDGVFEGGVATDGLYEPFRRNDASRSSGTGGNGLGLAVCQAASSANGWSLRLEQAQGQVVATVHFG